MPRPDTLIIRPIVAEDAAEWRRLWSDYLTFYETELPEEVFDTTFSRLLSGGKGEFRGFLAALDGKPVGLVHFLFHRTCWAIADTCYLQDLFADPDCRGKGIGRALIEAVYAAADAEGASGVYWLTQDFNATARKLYDRIGTLSPFIKYRRA